MKKNVDAKVTSDFEMSKYIDVTYPHDRCSVVPSQDKNRLASDYALETRTKNKFSKCVISDSRAVKLGYSNAFLHMVESQFKMQIDQAIPALLTHHRTQ